MSGLGAGNLQLVERLKLPLRLINAALLNQWELTQTWIFECKYDFDQAIDWRGAICTLYVFKVPKSDVAKTLSDWLKLAVSGSTPLVRLKKLCCYRKHPNQPDIDIIFCFCRMYHPSQISQPPPYGNSLLQMRFFLEL